MKQHRRLLFSALSIESVSLLAVIAIVSLALVGWVFDMPILKGVNPRWTPMRIITIICFFMSVAAMASLRQRTAGRRTMIVSRVSAAAISAVGLLTVVSYLVELNTGREWSWALSPPLSLFLASTTRMAVITAILFSIYGCVLLLLGTGSRRAAEIAHVILLPMAVMTYLVMVGYLFNVRAFYEWMHLGVALNTGAAFCALCIASFFARPDTWLMNAFTGDKAGAIMARRLLPALLILPLVIGWLRLQGERLGVFPSEVGVALVVVVYTLCFLSLVWLNAKSVNRTDQRRRDAEEDLRRSHDELELRVRERTSELSAVNKELLEQMEERKRAEQAVRTANAYNRSLLEASLDPLVTIDADGRITDVNHATEAVTGYSRRELINTDFASYFMEPERARAGYQRVFRESRVHDYALEIKHRDGHLTPVLYNAAVYRDNAGAVVGVFAAARDVTERRRAEKELERYRLHLEELVEDRTAELTAANKELESFAYTVSHDLRAPLRHMAGFVELLQKRIEDHSDERVRHYAGIISAASKKMGVLIDALLAFSRIGRSEIQTKVIDVTELVRDVVRELADELPGRDIEWKIGRFPEVCGDRALLTLTLTNLVANAVKFTRPRPRAEIEIACLEDTTGEFVFFVKDNGVGFDMKFKEKLFGVFQRLHHDDEFEGTGIGLANVRRIISRHGGRTWAEGAVGQGATFYFTLPMKKETTACGN